MQMMATHTPRSRIISQNRQAPPELSRPQRPPSPAEYTTGSNSPGPQGFRTCSGGCCAVNAATGGKSLPPSNLPAGDGGLHCVKILSQTLCHLCEQSNITVPPPPGRRPAERPRCRSATAARSPRTGCLPVPAPAPTRPRSGSGAARACSASRPDR